MDQNFFTQNPAFQNISPEKLAFLMNFMNQEKPDSSRDMMTFLMSFVTKARNQNLSFTTDETDFIIQHLRQGLNPTEQQRIDRVLQMLRRKKVSSRRRWLTAVLSQHRTYRSVYGAFNS